MSNQTVKPWKLHPPGDSGPLELTTCHGLPLMLHMELLDLLLEMQDFAVALVPFLCIPLFVRFAMKMSICAFEYCKSLTYFFYVQEPRAKSLS